MKITDKVPGAFRDQLRALALGLGNLDGEQGRVARMNARNEVRYRLHKLGEVMDAAFPVIPKKVTPKQAQEAGKRSLTQTQRATLWRRKMERVDYAEAPGMYAIRIAQAGIRLRTAPARTGITTPFAPRWALLASMGADDRAAVQKVVALKKDVVARRAFLAANALGAKVSP